MNTQRLVDKIRACSNCLFATTMFGKPEHINFDHDIVYTIPAGGECGPQEVRDLLNIDYPTSEIIDVYDNRHIYTFSLIGARLIDEQNDNDLIELKFSQLEDKIWRLIECLSDCDIIVMPGVKISRDSGTFNDKLVTVNFTFDLDVYSACLEPQC